MMDVGAVYAALHAEGVVVGRIFPDDEGGHALYAFGARTTPAGAHVRYARVGVYAQVTVDDAGEGDASFAMLVDRDAETRCISLDDLPAACRAVAAFIREESP